ncbi:penicillin-binding protein activator [Xinfangfangia sp. CPCC 101601]|uniref:Penicillin-binding protein activator n=1 Tax=Pseudogemmobacter lacusdianii TaxID=3069608 RepID=A0ABU0W0E1_9RHOB|nr:penicillin-binding protein activator [Xinfangfangia sp. CPCC 101601]MDQ2067358.1 penicillin-binding protein activator [Xinfangfangia sp. CPCC 101601]
MLSAFRKGCKSLIQLVLTRRLAPAALTLSALALSACVSAGPSGGPNPGRGEPVQVALLVPGGSGQATDLAMARQLENAARLAMADLSGVTIDLRVYQTGGTPDSARAMATKAMDEGAMVILGPVFAQEANAVGVAAAPRGISVLAFSNNTDIAGGNVYVLGPTFQNTASRLASFAVRSGKNRVMIVHDQNTAGEVGKAAIQRGVAAAGGTVVAVQGYEFSQSGVAAAAPTIVSTAKSAGASALFMTADTAGALPLLTQSLVNSGLDRSTTKFLGLTRWDIPHATLSLPGVQGGWFALPDPNLQAQFQNRYTAAYGEQPLPVAGLAYDGIAAIGALAKSGKGLGASGLTQGAGFVGVTGIFRFRGDGSNERGLAVAEIRNNQVFVIDPAPRSFSGAGL